MRRTLPAALAAAAFCALACPTLGIASGQAKLAQLSVTMTERACKVSARSARPGPAVFRIVNRGKRQRTFSIGGRRSPFVQVRKTALLRVRLVRGRTYRFTCTARGRPRSVRSGVLRVLGASQGNRPAPRPQPPPPPPPPAPGPPSPPTPPPPPPPAFTHSIGVRTVAGAGELYDVSNGTRFVARGANYELLGVPTGESATQDVTFNAGTYSAAAADAALAELDLYGYNTVRVFLNGGCATGCLGDPAEPT